LTSPSPDINTNHPDFHTITELPRETNSEPLPPPSSSQHSSGGGGGGGFFGFFKKKPDTPAESVCCISSLFFDLPSSHRRFAGLGRDLHDAHSRRDDHPRKTADQTHSFASSTPLSLGVFSRLNAGNNEANNTGDLLERYFRIVQKGVYDITLKIIWKHLIVDTEDLIHKSFINEIYQEEDPSYLLQESEFIKERRLALLSEVEVLENARRILQETETISMSELQSEFL